MKIFLKLTTILMLFLFITGCAFLGNNENQEPEVLQQPEIVVVPEPTPEPMPEPTTPPPQEQEEEIVQIGEYCTACPCTPQEQISQMGDEIDWLGTHDQRDALLQRRGILRNIEGNLSDLVNTMVDAGFIVQFGLADIFLLNQKLENDSLLDTIMFEAPRFINNQLGTVPIIANDDRLMRWGGGIFNRSNNSANPPISIFYFHAEHMTALEAVIWSIERDFLDAGFMPGAILSFGTIRSNDTFDMATGYFREDLGLGMWRYWIYVAQQIPGTSDIVILDIIISPFHWNETQWGDYEMAILAELSRHINVDLWRFAP